MSDYPPNPVSRRPEGSWPPPEDEDFKIVPPPGVSSPVSRPATSQPMPAPPPPPPPRPAAVMPPPPPVVVTPAPTRQVARPATPPANRSKLYTAIGAGVLLLAAIAFFIYFELVLNKPTTVASSQFTVAATAVAQQNWPTALPGCAALAVLAAGTPIAGSPDPKVLGQTYLGCGKQLVTRDHTESDVRIAQGYFQKADALMPNNADVQHQLDLAKRYLDTKALLGEHGGAFIDQMEWFTQQPEFDKAPYADTMSLLYKNLLDSGDNGLLLKSCAVAQHRYEQALALSKWVDTTDARRKLEAMKAQCP